MRRLDALKAIYPDLESRVVVTIMGAVAAELQSIGHRPNFFYLQHAMGLASSVGLGIALARPEAFRAVAAHSAMVLEAIPTAAAGAGRWHLAAFNRAFGDPIDAGLWARNDPLALAARAARLSAA